MKHYNVVAAVIDYKGKILCMQKGLTKYAYTSLKFEFPGGKIEEGESPEEALQRELMEEMDYHIHIVRPLVTVEHHYPDFEITLNAFLCSVNTPTFVMKEHKSFRWLLPKDLYKLEWAAADLKIINTF